MVNLDKDIEGKIEEIIGKYQKREAKLLNYLIVDDEITFFLPLSDDEKISDDDLAKISELITGEYIQTEWIIEFKILIIPFFYYLTNKVQKVYNISFPTGNITYLFNINTQHYLFKNYFFKLLHLYRSLKSDLIPIWCPLMLMSFY